MPTLQKEPNSLRSGGPASIAVDKPTRDLLHQLSGDEPLNRWLKRLAQIMSAGKQGALPGLPGALDTPASKEDLESLGTMLVRSVYTAVGFTYGFWGLPDDARLAEWARQVPADVRASMQKALAGAGQPMLDFGAESVPES